MMRIIKSIYFLFMLSYIFSCNTDNHVGFSNSKKYNLSEYIKNIENKKFQKTNQEECQELSFYFSHESGKTFDNYDIILYLNHEIVYHGSYLSEVKAEYCFDDVELGEVVPLYFWVIDKTSSKFQIRANKESLCTYGEIKKFKDIYVEFYYEITDNDQFSLKMKS